MSSIPHSSPGATVILNTYGDRPDELREAIESYLAQEDVAVQLVISTVEGDSALELVRSLYTGEPRVELSSIPLADHPGRGPEGIYLQLNRALACIRRPWWTYASGNDRALPSKLRDEIAACESSGKLVCYSSFFVGDRSLAVRRQARFQSYDFRAHLEKNFVSDCALVRTELLERLGGFRLECGNYAYWDFWLRAYEACGEIFAYNPKPEWIYRASRYHERFGRGSVARRAAEIARRERMLAEHRRRTGVGLSIQSSLQRKLRIGCELAAEAVRGPLGRIGARLESRRGASDPAPVDAARTG